MSRPHGPVPRRRVAADWAGNTDVVVVELDDIGPAADLDTGDAARTASRGWPGVVVTALLGTACLVGLILRWWPRGALWLDEAQSVAFASLPLDEIPGALREDGAPPLYYVLLHFWMWLVGNSEVAVRALSALLSTATVIVVAVLARRRWGPTVAIAATVLVATSPFAIRYAAHARMYALVMLEVVLAVAFVGRALDAPRLSRLAGVTIASAALLLTHYWSLYLVITATAVLLWGSSRPAPARTRTGRSRVAWALLGGFVLWLPWAPTFLFQAEHTGTPWATPANVVAALQVFASSIGGPSVVAMCLGALVAACFALGLRQRSGLPPAPAAIGLVGAVTAAVAVVGAVVSSSAVSNRYFAVAVPLVLLAAAAGLAGMRPAHRHVALAAMAFTGVWIAGAELSTPRTTARDVARVIVADARPGDVVVACPDQLAPALHRLLGDARLGLTETVFPPGSTAARVNWIDYAARARQADPSAAAHQLLAATPDATIWLVVSTTYPPTQPACAGLLDELVASRSGRRIIADRPNLLEHGALWRFEPGRPAIRQ